MRGKRKYFGSNSLSFQSLQEFRRATCCRKIDELFALLFPTANKNRNCQRQARPFAALYFRSLTIQPSPLDLRNFLLLPHLVCQSSCWLRVVTPKPVKFRAIL